MADKVKALKIENSVDGTQNDEGYTETDPNEDYLDCKGVVFENDDDLRIDIVDSEVTFHDAINGQKKLSEVISGSTHPNQILKPLVLVGSEVLGVPANDTWLTAGLWVPPAATMNVPPTSTLCVAG